MTDTDRLAPSRSRMPAARDLVLASRGDPLTPHLKAAIERRFGPVTTITPELTSTQRYLVAAATVRPTRERWVERFYKSGLAWGLRSNNAERQLKALDAPPSAVLQVHGLFTVPAEATVIYVDCTHRQSAELWPAWNPLTGAALSAWYRREQAAYRRAEHLFAFSRATKESLVVDYGVDPERVTVTGAAPNLRFPESAPSRRPAGPPTVLFVGNDFARKGGPELLAAFRRLRARVPDARLLLVGTSPDVAVEPGVEILGRIIDPRRMAGLYSKASVFALPSIYDPFPGALIEAMAYALPVVSTRQTGVPEIVTHGRTGRLVLPGDVEGLAEELTAIVSDPEGSGRLGLAARRDVAARMTWDAVVDRMAPVLEELLESR